MPRIKWDSLTGKQHIDFVFPMLERGQPLDGWWARWDIEMMNVADAVDSLDFLIEDVRDYSGVRGGGPASEIWLDVLINYTRAQTELKKVLKLHKCMERLLQEYTEGLHKVDCAN